MAAEVSRLGHHTKAIAYGTSQASNDKNWGYPTLRIPNVIGGALTTTDLTYVNASAPNAERFGLQPGDILMVRTNGNPNYVGRCAVFHPPDSRQWLFASYLMRIRLNQDELDPQFAAEYLNSARGRRELLRRVTTSAGNYNINAKNVASIPIPRPSLARIIHEYASTDVPRSSWSKPAKAIPGTTGSTSAWPSLHDSPSSLPRRSRSR